MVGSHASHRSNPCHTLPTLGIPACIHGPQNQEDEPTKDLTNWERLTLLPLIVAIVFLGIYPKPMLDRIEPAVDKLVTHIEVTIEDGSFTEPVPTTQTEHPSVIY